MNLLHLIRTNSNDGNSLTKTCYITTSPNWKPIEQKLKTIPTMMRSSSISICWWAKSVQEISLHNAWIETFKHDGESMIKPLRIADRFRAAGLDPNTPPGTFQMRPLVYRMFVRQVEKLGINVEFGQRVVEYFRRRRDWKGWSHY